MVLDAVRLPPSPDFGASSSGWYRPAPTSGATSAAEMPGFPPTPPRWEPSGAFADEPTEIIPRERVAAMRRALQGVTASSRHQAA